MKMRVHQCVILMVRHQRKYNKYQTVDNCGNEYTRETYQKSRKDIIQNKKIKINTHHCRRIKG